MQKTAPERVAALVRDGRKIEAIKIVREETGASLKDALRAVEAMENQATAKTSADPMEEAQALALEGRTVEAIRVLRDRSGLGLKEAKDVVDAMPQPPEARSSSAAAFVVLGLVVLLGIAAFVFLAV